MKLTPAPVIPHEPQRVDGIRVCIVAENASFRMGGEASLPLHYFMRLRMRGIEAWLITHARVRTELEALMPEEQLRILYIPDRWFHKLIWRVSRLFPRRIADFTFGALIVLINQRIQCGLIRNLLKRHDINVVHQPTPVSPRMPSFIAGVGIPVIIGPMNGGMDYPVAFRAAESPLTRAMVAFGRACSNVINRLIPGKKDASILLVANSRTRLALPQCCVLAEIHEIPENGVDLDIWTCTNGSNSSRASLLFVYIGRLVDWKRLDFALKALVDLPDATLEVIGDGPMRAIWAAEAEQLGIANRVRWLGWLSQSHCAKRLHGATALVLPSIYECGGAVVLEAMACGIPVIATAWGGPADYIEKNCGFLLDPTSSATMVAGIVAAGRQFGSDPGLHARMGSAARQRVEQLFDWDKKIAAILAVYLRSIQLSQAKCNTNN